MNNIFLTFIFTLFSISALSAQEIAYPENETATSEFTLTIHGINPVEGEVRVAVFNSKALYDEKEEPLYAVVLTVDEADSLLWKVDDLPFGEYAIAVYHDKNTNGKLDSNILGIPKEDYGFSNNARGRFGPASWKDAMFEVNGKTSEHSIEIK